MNRDELEDIWPQVYDEALTELYREATPGVNLESLDPVSERDRDDEPPIYLQHYLDGDRQEEVIEDVLDDYGVPEDLYFEAKKSLLLGKAPSTSLSNVDNARKDYGLQPVSQLLEPSEKRGDQ